jgi:hypothetical protein
MDSLHKIGRRMGLLILTKPVSISLSYSSLYTVFLSPMTSIQCLAIFRTGTNCEIDKLVTCTLTKKE